jgi:exodeoxyribonuclease VIII
MIRISRKLDIKNAYGLYDIDDQIYHNSPGISNSDMSLFARSAAHYQEIKLGNIRRERTTAMMLGSAVHTHVLEPEKFDSQYVVAPAFGDQRKKENKAAKESFIDLNAGKEIITQSQMDMCRGIAKKVHNYKTPDGFKYIKDELLSEGHTELSFFWKDKQTNLQCRGRADYIKNNGVIVDLKTTKSAKPRDFQKSIVNFRYYVQAAYYLDAVSLITGEKYNDFAFIAVEKEPPYEVCVYWASEDMIAEGRREYRRCLNELESCLTKREFPGYQTEPEQIGMPSWAMSSVIETKL